MSLKGGLLNYLVKPNLSHFSFMFIYEEPCNKFKSALTILDPTILKLPSEGKKKSAISRLLFLGSTLFFT